jgi:GT2 family glycosyltransferase
MRRIAVITATHNRKEVTIASLQSLFSQHAMQNIEISVFLMDDGSTDGTADAVAYLFPQVRQLQGNGTLYWNGGMRAAFNVAMTERFDGYIWWNDDSYLYCDAVSRIVTCANQQAKAGRTAIIVGTMRDPYSKVRTYGGIRKRTNGLRLHLDPVIPDEYESIYCHTMNGNFTLIPKEVAETIGNLDKTFRHQIGDLDYGLRATERGILILIAPGYFGECAENGVERTWRDRSLSLYARWKHLLSPKGAPIREWTTFTRRHYGWRWPLYALSPYLRMLINR